MEFKNKVEASYRNPSLINSFNKIINCYINVSFPCTHEKKQRVRKSTANCATCENLSLGRSRNLFRSLCQISYRMGAQQPREERLSTQCSQTHARKQLGKIKQSLPSTTASVMNILNST